MALLQQAADGDVNAIKLVLERIDGKPQEYIDLTSGGETVSFGFDFRGRNAEDR